MKTLNESLRNQFNSKLHFAFPQTDTDPAALHAAAGPVESIPTYGKVANVHGLGRLVKRYPTITTAMPFTFAEPPVSMCVRNDEDWTIAAVTGRAAEKRTTASTAAEAGGAVLAPTPATRASKPAGTVAMNPEATEPACPGLSQDDWSLVVQLRGGCEEVEPRSTTASRVGRARRVVATDRPYGNRLGHDGQRAAVPRRHVVHCEGVVSSRPASVRRCIATGVSSI